MTEEKGMSRNAALLLGVMLAEAGPNGTYSSPREAACRRLGWSDATLGRTLRELRGRGEIAVVTPGGGAGRPTVYRIIRLGHEQVEQVGGKGSLAGGSSVLNKGSIFTTGEEPAHRDRVHEGDQSSPSSPHLPEPDFMALGQGVVDFTAGFAKRAYEHWAALPTVGRALALAPVTCGVCWAIFRHALGKEDAYLGLLTGAAFAVLGALAAREPVSVPGSLPVGPSTTVAEGTG